MSPGRALRDLLLEREVDEPDEDLDDEDPVLDPLPEELADELLLELRLLPEVDDLPRLPTLGLGFPLTFPFLSSLTFTSSFLIFSRTGSFLGGSLLLRR